jgi:putative transposase
MIQVEAYSFSGGKIMNMSFDWNDVPQHLMDDYQERMRLVETLLDDSVSDLDKKDLREEYCRMHGVTDRTVRNYLAWYREGGADKLLFYHPSPPAERIGDSDLKKAILSLINERPTRTVRQIRYLLSSQDELKDKIANISNRTVYRFLLEQGLSKKVRYALLTRDSRISYHQFQASCSLELVQGDARDGIWLKRPDGKPKKTYMFAWVDDYSRKILYAEYYLDEKLPRMEDSFKKMVLRWGIPAKVYLDNGHVYVSSHFAWLLKDLVIKKIHHRPYAAYCKGKIESVMKIIKGFQQEAALAGFSTLDELNSALWAWIEMVYNTRIHSSTGEPPNKRFADGLPASTRRVTDIGWFEALFLLRMERTVTKYGQIKLFGNKYPLKNVPFGTVVEVRFNPFNLERIFVYRDKMLFTVIEASIIIAMCAPSVPEESRDPCNKVSQAARDHFAKLREQYQNAISNESAYIPYSRLKERQENDDAK